VVHAPPDRCSVGDADAQRQIGAIEDEPDLVLAVPQLIGHLEEEADVLDRRDSSESIVTRYPPDRGSQVSCR
jgi:hypothetical protein